MTARVTTLKGPDAGAYYVEALPSYYLDSGEPRGRWHGHGSVLLGLTGEVDDAAFLAVMAGNDPSGSVRLGRRYGQGSVRGFDVTASAPKSVSVLFAVGGLHTRRQVLEAHDAAVTAMIDWVERHAHTRHRINGDVATVDADGIIAAAFRQHTSRVLDPQLHTHVVIANRVRSPDGRWLALDARTVKLDQRTLSAVYHAGLRAELTRRIGVAWEPPVNGIADIAGVPADVLDAFSQRTAQVQARIDAKVDRFIDTFDRHPTPRERWRLEREAVVDSRPAKNHTIDSAALHRTWVTQLEALGHEPGPLVDQVVGRSPGHSLEPADANQMITEALAALSDKQSTWRPAEVVRELATVVPTETAADAARLAPVLDRIADHVTATRCIELSRPAPDGVRLRRDGRPVTESAVDRVLTTPAILGQEEHLLAWAEQRLTTDSRPHPTAAGRSRVDLSGPQADTAAAVAGHADLVLVVGPAGTGKTTALAPAIAQLRADGRPVFGVAPSAAAAEVLAGDTGVDADTIDKLLAEHRLARPPEPRYRLPAGSTVIVDEAGMLATGKLDQLAALANRNRWRVALVGDPLQFTAVGRGGMFAHLVHTHGAIELDRVHRFHEPWEADASLRLRHGDVGVTQAYDAHGRLHGGTASRMEIAAVAAWWRSRSAGQTALLAAPTSETVERLNHRAQQRRIAAGQLDPAGSHVITNRYRLHIGDEIATRRNDRHLRTDRGLMVRNRDTWTITTIGGDGSLTASGPSGTVRLPGDYVAAHVDLGYAQTSHATQGRTVDHAYLLLDGPTDTRGLYVPLTRGRHSNHAYIVTTGEDTAAELFTQALTRTWIDQPAVARRDQLQDQARPRHPRAELPPSELRALLDRQRHLLDTLAHIHPQPHLTQHLQRLHDQRGNVLERLTAAQASLDRSAGEVQRYDRPLRRRRHHNTITNAKAALRKMPAQIRWWENELVRLDEQIIELTRQHEGNRRQVEQIPRLRLELDRIEDRLRQDRQGRSGPLCDQHDQAAPVPGPKPLSGAWDWDEAAGRLHQLELAYGRTDPYATLQRLEEHGPRATNEPATRRLAGGSAEPPAISDTADWGLSL